MVEDFFLGLMHIWPTVDDDPVLAAGKIVICGIIGFVIVLGLDHLGVLSADFWSTYITRH